MILYNVTINIDKDVEAEWLSWMKTSHIPKVMATGMFLNYKMYRLLGEIENAGATYSVQYFTDNMQKVENYLEEYAPDLVKEHKERYQHKHVAFRTLLEQV